MTTNTKEYQNKYMKDYIKSSPVVECPNCFCKYKKINTRKHLLSKRHNQIFTFNSTFKNLGEI